jgi:hypothetical protein
LFALGAVALNGVEAIEGVGVLIENGGSQTAIGIGGGNGVLLSRVLLLKSAHRYMKINSYREF